MKPKFAREIALLTLPILIIGGVAFLRLINGRIALPSFLTSNPFDPGPMRVEFSPLRKVQLEPIQVAQGIDWAASSNVQIRGRWNTPTGWKKAITGISGKPNWLVYRRGEKWKTIPNSKNGESAISANLDLNGNYEIDVRLDNVPKDADEIRLRGRFIREQWYTGKIPSGWKPPKNLLVAGPNRILTLVSPPFDVQIKGPNQPLSVPVISHKPDLELVRAVWLNNLKGQQFFVIVRHISPNRDNTKIKHLRILSCVVKDGNGKPLPLFYPRSKWPVQSQNINLSFGFNEIPKLLEDQSATNLWSDKLSPRGGWKKVKQPISIEAKISTGSEAWPLTARATIRQQEGDVDTLEARPIR